MANKLAELYAAQKALRAEANAIFATAEAEDNRDLTEAESTRLSAIKGEVSQLDEELCNEIAELPDHDPEDNQAAIDAALTAERNRATEITAACLLSGMADRATAYIKDGKTLGEVVTTLQADRAAGSESLHTGHNQGSQTAAANWDDVAKKMNARLGIPAGK